MNTPRHIHGIALVAALAAVLVLPASSLAEYYVPPSNSAANQYTETFPGAGGESGGKRKPVSPHETLGARNANRLEQRGPAGEAAAEMAAKTAPPQLLEESGSGGGPGGSGGAVGNAQNPRGGGPDGTGSGSTTPDGPSTPSAGGGTAGQPAKVDQPEGSSALGQVVGQATGAGDGDFGPWLPLAIVLMLLGSVAYAVHTRQAHRA
jgi:hypothetical protein